MLFIQMAVTDPRYFFAWILVVVFSICLHELAHGVVAVWLGDKTPIEEGRITLNPMIHMGPVSIIALLIGGIAWGAMPVNPRRMRGWYAPALVAAAGPAMNLLLSLLALVGLGLWFRFDPGVLFTDNQAVKNGRFLLLICGIANMLLMLFNLIPFPPLDGSKILGSLSGGYERAVEATLARSPGLYLMGSLFLFVVAGRVLSPLATDIAQHIVQFAAR